VRPPIEAPTDLLPNAPFQAIFTFALSASALGAVWLALRGPVRRRDRAEFRLRSLVLAGAALGSVVFEPAGDRLVQCWYLDGGMQWTLVRFFGGALPIWALPVYVVFIGGSVLLILDRVRRGSTHRELVAVLIAITGMNIVIELPILAFGGLYGYYGRNQPLWHPVWFPMPAWVLLLNWLLILTPSIIVLGVLTMPRPSLEWALPLLIPGGLYAGYGLAGWPAIGAIHNGESLTVTTAAALVTVTLSVGSSLLCCRLLPGMRHVVRLSPTYSDPRHPAGHPKR